MNMRRQIVNFACVTAVALSGAQGQSFVHFDIGLSTPVTATASPSTTSQEVMVARIVDEQLSLQTGTCASTWTSGLSSQCPSGSFMALKGYGDNFRVTVPSFFACRPVGCLPAPAHHRGEGEGGGEAASVSLNIPHCLAGIIQCSTVG